MPDATPVPPVIYVDTSVWGNLLLDHSLEELPDGTPKATAAGRLFTAIGDGRVILATSGLVKAELMCRANFAPEAKEHRLVDGWFDAESTRWIDLDRFLADEAIDHWGRYRTLRAEGRPMRGADAIHLAAAVRLKADYLMTTDKGFPLDQDVGGVRVSYPTIVWEETLLDNGGGPRPAGTGP